MFAIMLGVAWQDMVQVPSWQYLLTIAVTMMRHMFPLVPVPPTCREAWIVCLADKWCALRETVAGRLRRKGEADDGVSGESSEKRRG